MGIIHVNTTDGIVPNNNVQNGLTFYTSQFGVHNNWHLTLIL